MKRRTFLFGSLGAITAGWWAKPTDQGEAYLPYFSQLNSLLKSIGPHTPSLIIDLDKLNTNIDILKHTLPSDKAYRIVAKSLPSIPLIKHVMIQANTNRVMAFHQPFLSQIASELPNSDVLMGKPMPVTAAEIFYQTLGSTSFNPRTQLQWLLDTPARLNEYLSLAKKLNSSINVSIELDVGLHRGGVANNETLNEMLATIKANQKHLSLAGFMGYEPHVAKSPSILGSKQKLLDAALGIYQSFIDYTRQNYPELWNDKLVLNGGGSPTYRLYKQGGPVNELSVGSALLKPTDFDIEALNEHIPAAYIATPVLKRLKGTRIPGVESLSSVFSWWDPNQKQTFFIYGGYWKAKLENPKGLQINSIFGRSTNQEIINGSGQISLRPNDHVFLRPTQSEHVLLQFGSLIIVKKQKIFAKWDILHS